MEPLESSSTFESPASSPEASEFGASLRDMRVAHNTDVSTVATTLRIRQVYLQAIEDRRFHDLPGPTYAAGFVRAYAEYLGLDIAETMQRYRDVTGNTGGQTPLVAPSPVVEGRVPTGFILLVAAVLVATAYGSWYYLSLNGRDAGDMVAKLPQQIADMVGLSADKEIPVATPQPVVSGPKKPVPRNPSAVDDRAVEKAAAEEPAVEEPAAAKPSPPAPAPETPAKRVSPPAAAAPVVTEVAAKPIVTPSRTETPRQASSSAPDNSPPETPRPDTAGAGEPASAASEEGVAPSAAARETVAPVVSAVPDRPEVPASVEREEAVDISAPPQQQAALPEPPASVAAEATGRVVLRATAISWVELRDGAGKRVFSRLMKKGEIYNVPAQSGITLATGNAGALDILVDGQVISPIGPPGSVKRDVLLEPAALLGGSAGSQ
jgi:cytoskeletal protein RodZ